MGFVPELLFVAIVRARLVEYMKLTTKYITMHLCIRTVDKWEEKGGNFFLSSLAARTGNTRSCLV